MLSSAVIPALPTLQHDLHASETGVTWLLTGFLLSAPVGTAIIGKLGDTYGKQRRRGRSAVRRERDHLLEGCSARFCHQRGGAARRVQRNPSTLRSC